jgi:dihydroorotate dehydrogenase (NAD+) catalytic subunit
MAPIDLSTRLGPVTLSSPLVGASGTIGAVVDFDEVADLSAYGAAVAKSVSLHPWPGNPPPRLAPAGAGVLNSIGIQNPGIEAWIEQVMPRISSIRVPVWGSAVGHTPEEFAAVAGRMAGAGVPVIELNLSCPNLRDGQIFALEAKAAAEVVAAVREMVRLPLGAKLSPNAADIAEVASACAHAGADWVVLTNTIMGSGIDISTRRPLVSGISGGYSGSPLKPIALRCVVEVSGVVPGLPIIGCGGVSTGSDVIEYLMAGASAVGLGTIHFAEPKAARRILREFEQGCRRLGVVKVSELVGTMQR